MNKLKAFLICLWKFLAKKNVQILVYVYVRIDFWSHTVPVYGIFLLCRDDKRFTTYMS